MAEGEKSLSASAGFSTLERVRALVSTQLGVAPEEVVPDARILDDLGADSLDVVELVMALEEAFDVSVPDDDVTALRTIGDVSVYLDKRLSG